MNYEWFGQTPSHFPYCWHVAEEQELLGLSDAMNLAESFPKEGFIRLDRSTRLQGKSYRNYSLPTDEGHQYLPTIWQQFINEIQSVVYRRSVAQLLNQPIAEQLELRFVKHGPGDWLGPHTDSEDKLFSHVFYFNINWQAHWGGTFDVLAQNDASDIVRRVIPVLGSSVILGRSHCSWHQVAPVIEGVDDARCSFLVHGLIGGSDEA
nr:2OG-Fe(II) oxygenase [Pseudoalteromonas sp. S16_S37]